MVVGTPCVTSVVLGRMRPGWPQASNSELVSLFRGYSNIVTNKYVVGTEIPMNEYYEYFGPDYQLDVKSSNMEDMNTPGYLERVKNIVMENLRQVGGPPSVQMAGSCFLHSNTHT